jgi:O-antigen ligase
VAVVGSRAGLGLGFIAGLLCMAMAYRDGVRGRRRVLAIALAGFLIASFIAFQFVLAGWERRGVEDRDVVEDLRWPVAMITLQAAQQYLPLGSGFGTFVPIYQMSSPRSQVFERYVNHAHDDWLEAVLEGGIPALACIAGFLAWFGRASLRAWGSSVHLDGNFARAGSAAIVLLMLHSIVDYPLRSIAIMTVFALSCGFLIPAKNTDRSRTAVNSTG